ncbi:hypothetical protein CEXT_172251 [Caerostris extrusa]|uniref:Uncharacterized protein n=1 Tax=Caerostris extrusa TaxID=172846 RepID=A0AAV4MPH0_CAEEX|nr:hypothetical protein CEXT_172251 [Caerostris extrusa]
MEEQKWKKRGQTTRNLVFISWDLLWVEVTGWQPITTTHRISNWITNAENSNFLRSLTISFYSDGGIERGKKIRRPNHKIFLSFYPGMCCGWRSLWSRLGSNQFMKKKNLWPSSLIRL